MFSATEAQQLRAYLNHSDELLERLATVDGRIDFAFVDGKLIVSIAHESRENLVLGTQTIPPNVVIRLDER
jgi:hypothetical protein